MMPDPTPSAADFAHAEMVCGWLHENMKIQFQIDGLSMSREEAVKHFAARQALISVQGMLITAAERELSQ